jgi:separase
LSLKCSPFRECENDDIKSHIRQFQKDINYQKGGANKVPSFEEANKYLESEVTSTCRNIFPKDWTVIQLCKSYNPYELSSTFKEIMTYDAGITMTIFKHSAINDMMMVDIEKPNALDNVYEKIFKLDKMITDNKQQDIMTNESSEKDAREKYQQASQEIDVFVQDIINHLTSFLGPWVCALTGKFKSRKAIETENQIRIKVYEFLRTRNYFTEEQQKLIHLVARRTDLLSHQQIFVAITYILREKPNLGYEDIDLNDLYDHLTWIKQQYKYEETSTHPCILIIDDLLDQLPFEMVNTQQEFTRICSFANLKRMCSDHTESFDYNGYVVQTLSNCQAVVNPEKNLKSMEARMQLFFEYWTPTWKVTIGKIPEDFHNMLSKSDVFIYSGHGSGLQILSDNVFKLKSRSVVFLFGCGSVGLQSTGLNNELTGVHNYYHLGQSPCGK